MGSLHRLNDGQQLYFSSTVAALRAPFLTGIAYMQAAIAQSGCVYYRYRC